MSARETGWRVGDLAVCVPRGRQWFNFEDGEPTIGPRPEQVLRVSVVNIEHVYGHWIWLSFEEFGDSEYPSIDFRKIKPDAEPADDAALIAMICGRVEVAA